MTPEKILMGKNTYEEQVGQTHAPISVLHLTSFLQSHLSPTEFEIEIFDFRLESPAAIKEKMESLGEYNYFCLSNGSSYEYLENMKFFYLAKKINPNIVSIIGGYHPLVVPGDYAFSGSPVDFVVQGEGERPLLDIIQRSIVQRPKRRISRLIFGRPVSNLDEIPPIDWTIYERYLKDVNHDILVDIILSRGCPGTCAFCVEKNKDIPPWRGLSPERAIQDIISFYQYITGIGENINRYLARHQYLIIGDVLFGHKVPWTRKFLQLFKEKELPFGLFLEMRSDTLSKALLQQFKEVPITILFGFETASPQQLSLLNKTPDPVHYIAKCKENLQAAGENEIAVSLNLLAGTPGETPETLMDTVNFLNEAIKLDPYILPNLPKIYSNWPGTLLFDRMPFFERTLGTKFYFKKYWYSKNPHFLSKLIDPSEQLNLVETASIIIEDFYPLFKDLILLNPRSQDCDKLAVYSAFKGLERELLRRTAFYNELHDVGIEKEREEVLSQVQNVIM